MLGKRFGAEATLGQWNSIVYSDKNIRTARLEPDRVLAAFQKTGKKPAQGRYAGSGCLCGITSVYEAEIQPINERDDEHFIRTRVGLNFAYFQGFMCGWDGDVKHEETARLVPTWSQGYDDGKAAWEACRNLASTKEGAPE